MPHYNITLTPINPAIATSLTQCAQKYFKSNYDEYLLGKKALPHVTLAHFDAENDEAAIEAYKGFSGKQQLMLQVTKFDHQHKPENNNHWTEFTIEESPELIALQKAVYEHLKELNLAPKQEPSSYKPHITLARVKEKPSLTPSLADIPEPYKYKFRMSLGASTKIGAYTKTLMA